MRNTLFLFTALASAAVAIAADNSVSPAVQSGPGYVVYGTRAIPEQGSVTALAAALAQPAAAMASEQKIAGRIGQVCQAKGCWMSLTEGDQVVRVFFGKHDFFIPKDTQGNAVVYGKLSEVEIDEATAKHLAEDGGGDPSKATAHREYRITASAVQINTVP